MSECTLPSKCCLCDGSHKATEQTCPRWAKQLEIAEIRTKHQVGYKQALNIFIRKHSTKPMTTVGKSWGPSLILSDSERVVPKTILSQSYKQAFLNNKHIQMKASTSNESSDDENSNTHHAIKKIRHHPPKYPSYPGHLSHQKYPTQANLELPGHSKDQTYESMTVESEEFKIPQSRPKRAFQPTIHKKPSKPNKSAMTLNESMSEAIPGKIDVHPSGQITKTVIVKEKIYVNDVGVQAGQTTIGTQTEPIIPIEPITQTEPVDKQGNPIMIIKGENNISELLKVITKNLTVKNGKPHWTTKQISKKLKDMTGISVSHEWVVQSLHV